MQLFKIEKEWNAENKHFPLIFLGDCHVGSPNCDYQLLEEEVAEIAKMKNATVFLMGDQAEFITIGDKRFRATGIDRRFWSRMEELPMAYLDYLEELFDPIAHMIEVVHDGNHENHMFPTMYPGAELCCRLRKRVEDKYGSAFAQKKLRYAPGEAYTKIMWQYPNGGGKYRSVMVNTAHGWQAGRQAGSKVNEMSKMFSWVGAEIIVRGHCLSEDTEILTTSGWKKYNEVSIGDKLLNFSLDDNKIKEDTINNVFIYDNIDKIVKLKTDVVELLITDGHNIINRPSKKRLDESCNEWSLSSIDNFMDGHSFSIEIPVASQMNDNKDIDLSDDWIKLSAWLITEGHFRVFKTSKSGINIYQNEGPQAEEIKQILENLGLEYSVSIGKYAGKDFTIRGKTYTTKKDCVRFYIKEKSAKEVRKVITSKLIPSIFFDMSQRQFELFLETMIKGDGSYNGPNTVEYYSASKELIEQLQILCFLNGRRTNLKTKDGRNYRLQITGRNTVTVANKNLSYIPYNGKTWCVSTTNGTIVVRRNGKIAVVGNSHEKFANPGPPMQSPNNNMTKLREIQTVYGHSGSYLKTLEITDRPSYAELAGYRPLERGHIEVHIDLNDRGLRKSIHVI